MQLHIYDTPEKACRAAAFLFAAQITEKADSVLGLATGSTPIPCYQDLISFYNQGLLDFSQITTFNLDEYCGIDYKHPESYHAFMDRNLFDFSLFFYQNARISPLTLRFYAVSYQAKKAEKLPLLRLLAYCFLFI